MTHNQIKQIAFICNEPTPYRLHLLERIARELPEVQLHSIFTHRLKDAHVPWQMDLAPQINPVFFEKQALKNVTDLRRANQLYHQIVSYLKTQKVKLIILNGYNDLARARLVQWAHRQHVPLLIRGDSNIHSENEVPWLRGFVKRRYLRWLLGHIAGLMPMGQCGEAFFQYWVKHELPIFRCPYEPDYELISQCDASQINAFREQFKLNTNRRYMLFCGRLVAVKKVDVLIDAFIQVADQRPSWDLLIAGDGPLRQDLERRIPTSLQSRVKFLGFLQFNQTVAYYHCGDLLVHPSAYEPWALVINEAIAAHLPIIATNVTGAAMELVKPNVNGLLVSPNDVLALKQAIIQVTQTDTLQRMTQATSQVLSRWRQEADPVEAIKRALHYFGSD